MHWHPGNGSLLTLFGMQKAGSCKRGSETADFYHILFAMFVVMYKLRKPDLEIPVYDYFTIRPQWKEIRRILNIGIPSGIENSMFQFGKLAIQSTVSMMGTAAIAAQGMTNTLENLNGIMAIGVGIGLMTVVGECMGAGRQDEAIYYVKKLSIIGEVVVIASCLFILPWCVQSHILEGWNREVRLCAFSCSPASRLSSRLSGRWHLFRRMDSERPGM